MRLWLFLILAAGPVAADPARVLDVTLEPVGGTWRVDVTVAHADTGWDHYADAWEVLAPDGTSLGLRTLLHPHVDEQPFTRSLSGVTIPDHITEVGVRARCLEDGWTWETLTVPLPGR